MNDDLPILEELPLLAEAMIEGRLTEEQRHRLEELVLATPEARRFVVEYLHQHACLQWAAADAAFLQPGRSEGTQPPVIPATTPASARPRWWNGRAALAGMAATAAVLTVGVMLWFVRLTFPSPVATLVANKGCKWSSATVPTETGARLRPGRLRLADGLARIIFDSGAEITLEAPADLEVVSAMSCVLHAGRLVAKVPQSAHGFGIDTPTAVLTDLGTEFGVHVHDEKTADVQVFNGRVDAQHRASGRVASLTTGQRLRFLEEGQEPFNPDTDLPRATGRTVDPKLRILDISTAQGRGKEAFVQTMEPPPDRRSDILLLVKNTASKMSDWHRKAYIGLDLTPLAGHRVCEAELALSFAPTGMGFASECPDATFGVYGLTDESLDHWSEARLKWADAPANRPGGTSLDLTKVMKLGTFEIAQGQLSGTRTLSGPALVDFLNRDTNGLVTLILVRETAGSGRSDLVHGFANRRHPDLPPPTLRLTLEPRP